MSTLGKQFYNHMKLNLEKKLNLNSHAVAMALAQPLDFKIDFARNPISGSAA